MITLVTGVPGAGKTLFTVANILKVAVDLNEKLKSKGEPERPIFVEGIPDLLLQHDQPLGDIKDWHKWLPDGALFIIDEIQRFWRPAGSGAAVPDDIAALETHRHSGTDIVIMTQHPMLLHRNVRNLVGKHIHIRRTALGKHVYEFSECSTNLSWKGALTHYSWSYPKEAFKWYKSATMHQVVKFRMPAAVWYMLASLILLAGSVGFLYHQGFIGHNFLDIKKDSGSQSSDSKSVKNPPLPKNQTEQQSQQSQQSKKDDVAALIAKDPIEAFRPMIPDRPETAPAYANLREPRNLPRIAGCMKSPDDCRCYTEQGTIIKLSVQQCRFTYDDLNSRYDAYSDRSAGMTIAQTVRGSETASKLE